MFSASRAWAAGAGPTKVRICESGNNYSINTGNGYYGAWRFDYPSWHANGGGQFAAYPNYASRTSRTTWPTPTGSVRLGPLGVQALVIPGNPAHGNALDGPACGRSRPGHRHWWPFDLSMPAERMRAGNFGAAPL